MREKKEEKQTTQKNPSLKFCFVLGMCLVYGSYSDSLPTRDRLCY